VRQTPRCFTVPGCGSACRFEPGRSRIDRLEHNRPRRGLKWFFVGIVTPRRQVLHAQSTRSTVCSTRCRNAGLLAQSPPLICARIRVPVLKSHTLNWEAVAQSQLRNLGTLRVSETITTARFPSE